MPRRPKLPKVSFPGNPVRPLRKALDLSHQGITQARGDIRSVADDLHGFSILGHGTPAAIARPETAPRAAPVSPSDQDTLLYQLDHLVSVLKQSEIHLSEGCKIMGIPCDCCAKHALEARTFAMETISIAARMDKETAIYQEIADWASEIEELEVPGQLHTAERDEALRQQSGTASNFRKQVQAMISELKTPDEECDSCTEVRESIQEFIEKRQRERGEA